MRSRAIQLHSIADLAKLPAPSWLIDGVLPAAGLSVLYGAPGTGKSFLALDWALSVATGSSWCGHHVTPGPVVFIAAEGRTGLSARIGAWETARNVWGGPAIAFLTEPVDLLDRTEADAVGAALQALPQRPVLIVVDTLARTMGCGDENSTPDMSAFIAAVDRLRSDGAAVVVHHTGKGGDMERGSTALRGAADLMASVKKKHGHVEVHCSKLKDAPEWPPISARLERFGGSCALIEPRAGFGVAEVDADLKRLVELVRAADEPLSSRGLRDGLPGMGARRVEAAKQKALQNGEIENVGKDTAHAYRACPTRSDTSDTLASEGVSGTPPLKGGAGTRPNDTPDTGQDQ